MGIKLSWVNDNTGEDGTRIYRSDQPIDPVNLPTPIATVGPGVTEYDDTSVPDGVVRHYRFGVFTGDEEVLSENEAVYTSTYTGPGPQTLKAGSVDDVGFFGTLNDSELFNHTELEQYGSNLNAYTDITWAKVFHEGKVKFIASPYTFSDRWQEMYHSGLLFGEQGDCFDKIHPDMHSILTPTDQYTTMSKDGHSYLARSIRIWPDYDTDFETEFGGGSNLVNEKLWGSEFFQILSRIYGHGFRNEQFSDKHYLADIGDLSHDIAGPSTSAGREIPFIRGNGSYLYREYHYDEIDTYQFILVLELITY